MLKSSAAAQMQGPRDTVTLQGMVRDFKSDHPDFGLGLSPLDGHYAGLMAPRLGTNGRPVFVGAGRNVVDQFRDRDDNRIKPYGDRGLVGGHFDIDVFASLENRQRYHKHEFDDRYDTATINIAGFEELLFDDICAGYPNLLRVEVLNPHNSGLGQYVFETDDVYETGAIAGGITRTFFADDVSQFAVTFQTLSRMRGTKPGQAQNDSEDRDDAFAIRLFDTLTDEKVYEIVAYEHVGKDDDDAWDFYSPDDREGVDACGDPIDDRSGIFGAPGNGAITDADSFNEWYRYTPGTNLEKPHGVVLERDPNGVYSFETDRFYPVDGELYGNEGEANNSYFTYSISATGIYTACTDQFIEIQSSDDVWVYINGELVIDIGGVRTPSAQYFALDRLNLADDEEFQIDVFYANRGRAPDSVFRLRTNIEFPTSELTMPSMAGWD